ncbi:MAG: VOC family protein [Acidimicrobiia bacterium]|nr:MAG: VOC family protein [Acidimicrobiia bacterium]
MLSLIDHLVFATPDLEAGVTHIEDLLGVKATPGGRHPRFGTHNALVSLGRDTYLEIVGPDPLRDTDQLPEIFELSTVDRPKLVTWAARSDDLGLVAARARSAGIDLGDVSAGSRKRPDGILLEWQLTDPYRDRMEGIIPFFIDWGTTSHPASSLPPSCRLMELTLSHSEPSRAEEALEAVTDMSIPVTRSKSPHIQATIATPNGSITLT